MAKKRGNDLAMPNFEEELITVIDSRMAAAKPNNSNNNSNVNRNVPKHSQPQQPQQQPIMQPQQSGMPFVSDNIILNDNEWPAATVIVGNGRRRSGGSSVSATIRQHQPSGRSRSSDHALIRRRPHNNLVDDNVIYTIDEQPIYPTALSSSQPLTKYYNGPMGTHPFAYSGEHHGGHLYEDYERTNSVNEFRYTAASNPETYQHPAHRTLSDQSLRSPNYESGHPGRIRHRSYSSYPHRRLPVTINYPSEW